VDVILPLLTFAAIGVAVWFFAKQKPDAIFVVRVRAGEARAASGAVTGAFLAAVADVCHEFNLSSAEVYGVARGRRIALRFSTNFPFAACQRLRNWWAQSGWPAPSRKSSRR
jgi:hypothetical protein